MKLLRQSIKAMVRKLKDKPCAECGERYPPWVMDFDHRPGVEKVLDLSRAVRKAWSERQILEEAAKCDVVCSNCHRDRTYKRALMKAADQTVLHTVEAGSTPAAPTIQ